jgi:YHS domain-containing protein
MLELVELAFIIFLVYIAYKVARFFKSLNRPRTAPDSRRQVQGIMVKDDVCNTYIPKEEAIREVRDGQERFFCSEECRRKSHESAGKP